MSVGRQTIDTTLPGGHHARFAMTKDHIVLDVNGRICLAYNGRWMTREQAAALALSLLEVLS